MDSDKLDRVVAAARQQREARERGYREQRPARALIYGRTDDGLRFVANTRGDDASYARLTGEHQVGQRVRLRHANGVNLAEFVD